VEPQISFIVSARNEEPSIVAETVAGILATSGSGSEILVVDDASVQPVEVSGPGVTVIRNPEPAGVTRARQIGTVLATGRVLVWLDAHMTFEPGWLEIMLREVDSGALLCAPWRDYDRRRIHCWGSDFRWCEERAYDRGLRPGFDFSQRPRPPRASSGPVPMIIGACYMMRRDAFDRIGGFCPLFRTYGGDEPDLSARAWLSGGSVRCVTGAMVGHLDRTTFPYPVGFDDVEFNQLVMLRSLFEDATIAVLEEFFQPLPGDVERRLAQTDISGWRSEVRSRRRISDAEFFRGIAPKVPISFGSTVRARRGHLPSSTVHNARAQEEAAYTDAEVLSTTAPTEQIDFSLSPSYRLIQAAVVTWHNRAILLPGGAETGRCALVAELVRAGATLYSDSYAVLDPAGVVHPFPVASRGSRTDPSVSVGVVAMMQFHPGRLWRLDTVCAAAAALELLANAIGVRDATIFQAVNHAVNGSIALQGRRGPAAPVARALLEHIARWPSDAPGSPVA
jgi:hypothetical protein